MCYETLDPLNPPLYVVRLHRKPEPRIYELACQRNNIAPHEAVFLDDLGMYVGCFCGLRHSVSHRELIRRSQEPEGRPDLGHGDDT